MNNIEFTHHGTGFQCAASSACRTSDILMLDLTEYWLTPFKETYTEMTERRRYSGAHTCNFHFEMKLLRVSQVAFVAHPLA